jgi:hypothetical protein
MRVLLPYQGIPGLLRQYRKQYPGEYRSRILKCAFESHPPHPLNFGITSVANALSCSSITAFGVPMLMLTFTYSRPG